jgi:hypothetical protein
MADRADRHRRDPITYRPPADTYGWLEEIAGREGRPVRAVVGSAVEQVRRIDEAGLGAFAREQDRRMMAWLDARNRGDDGAEELAGLNAAMEAYRHAIGSWQPRRLPERPRITRSPSLP